MTPRTTLVAALMMVTFILLSSSITYAEAEGEDNEANLQDLILSNLLDSVSAVRQSPLNLGSAKMYAILSKAGVTNVPGSKITGNIGVSPIAASAITGFSLKKDATNRFATSPQVVGKIYAANYAPPTPADLTAAIGDMQTAYTDAAGRSPPDHKELFSGAIGGRTLRAGLYKWSGSVSILSDVVLTGSATDVWIFQISGNLFAAPGKRVTLGNNARAKNIFWQVAGKVTMDTTSHLAGIILSKTSVHMKTGATLAGRIYAQTAVTLDHATVTGPAW
jgi:hypothetical protein